ncbi:hypothetical protein M5K25_027804 [Dendrobium thyrsiflorum]|uniref:Uncharacterized protein n=1 Tax=Dendrobium thyrsiflorum TaxID=117978 RepID=A0ABD0TUZ1_DENTH
MISSCYLSQEASTQVPEGVGHQFSDEVITSKEATIGGLHLVPGGARYQSTNYYRRPPFKYIFLFCSFTYTYALLSLSFY